VAVQIASILYMAPVTVGKILFPRVASMRENAWPFTRRAAGVAAAFMAVVCLGAAVLAPVFIRRVYGGTFQESAVALRWLLPGTFTLSINTILANHLAGRGMPPVTFIAPLVALTLDVALNLMLLPVLGVRGAALNSSISYSAMLATTLLYLRNSHAAGKNSR